VLKNHETKSEKTFPDDFAHSPMFFTILLVEDSNVFSPHAASE
jgi:hypothetical protein